MTSVDAAALQVAQRASWTGAAAAWQRWSGLHAAATRDVTEALCDAVRAAPGRAILDVAGGVGDPALTLARRVAPGGRVVSIDLAPGMVEAMRAAGSTLPHFEAHLAPAEAPPPGPWQGATCRFGLMFLADPRAAVRAWAREIERGGRVAIALWSGPDENPMSALRTRAVRDVLGSELPPSGPGMDTLNSESAARALLHDCGLAGIEVRRVGVTWAAPGPLALATMMCELNPPLASTLAAAGSEASARVIAALSSSLSPFTQKDGRVMLPGGALVAAGAVS